MENNRGASRGCIERNTFPHKFKKVKMAKVEKKEAEEKKDKEDSKEDTEKPKNAEEDEEEEGDKCTICLCGEYFRSPLFKILALLRDMRLLAFSETCHSSRSSLL